jgi:ElaB/YqjD/DUF883 family membrane-anchored ribosome-binding protein
MPDTRPTPDDVPPRESSFASSEQNLGAASQQPDTPVNLNVDYGAPGVPGPAARDPHDKKYLGKTAPLSSVRSQDVLHETAVKIGTLIGTTVNIVRGVQRQLESVPNNVVSMREHLRERGQEFRHDASDAAREWRQAAQARVQQARRRTAQYVHENPFHVIIAVAGVAFCAGVALRIWRSRLD